jgi:hypothetical protein
MIAAYSRVPVNECKNGGDRPAHDSIMIKSRCVEYLA